MQTDSPQRERQRARLFALLLFLVGAAILLPRISAYGLWDPTEVRVADAARALDNTHTQRIGTPAPPALNVLLAAQGMKLFGVGELGGRLPIALLSLLTLIATYFVGRSVLRPRAALLGAVALLTMPSFLFGGRQLTTGIPLLFSSVLAVGGLIYAVWPPAGFGAVARFVGMLVAAGGLFLGTRANGVLVGAIAPLLAAWLAVFGASRARRGAATLETSFAALAATGAGITATVLAALAFWAWRHHGVQSPLLGGVPRALQYQTVVTSLLRQLGFATAPWLALVPFALFRALDGHLPCREDDTAERADFSRLVWPATLATTYFMATLQAAAVGDLLVPGGVAIALLCGAYLDDFLERPTLRAIEGVAVIVLVIVLAHDVLLTTDAFVSVQTLEVIRWPTQINYTSSIIFGVMTGFGVLAGGALLLPPIGALKDSARRLAAQRSIVLGALGLQVLFAAALVQWFIPVASKHLSPKDLYGKTKQLDPKAPLGTYHFNATGASYYMNGRTATPLNTTDDLLAFLRRPERVFVFVGSEELAAIEQATRGNRPGGAPTPPRPASPNAKLTSPDTKPSSPDAKPTPPSVPATPSAPTPGGLAYFVIDDSNSHFLIISNHVMAGERDLNPLHRLVSVYAPKPKTPLLVNFDDKLQLLGYDLPTEAQRGEDIMVRLYFKVLSPVGSAYKIFLHFDGPGARVNGDHVPLDGRFPTQFWTPDTYVTDEYLLKPDRSTQPAGLFQLYFGLFAGDHRLKVKEGPSDGENRVKLGAVSVK